MSVCAAQGLGGCTQTGTVCSWGGGGLDILTCRSEGEHDGSAVRLKSLPLNKPTHGAELLK